MASDSEDPIASPAAERLRPDVAGEVAETAGERTAALLRALWQQNLPLLRSRLAVLDEAATAARFGTLGDGLRAEAISTAHKLAGSLGMFGYPEGTRIAREMEYALSPASDDASDAAAISRLADDLHGALGIDLPSRGRAG